MSDEQYFSERPHVTSEPVTIDVVLPDVTFRMRTDRGVFSHRHLDVGTALLLRADVALPSAGDLLDLGCGAGAIALTMALRAPGCTVWALDVNARARELCAANAGALGLENVRVVAPVDVPETVTFDAIWSNPPIRIGKSALHELLERWLARLAPAASATLVVQRHLGADSLQRWLESRGWSTSRRASKAGFRLLDVTRPS